MTISVPKSSGRIYHSVADWDFGTPNWELSAVHFVSPPTALRGRPGNLQWCLCRVAGSLNLPQGRIVFSAYNTGVWGPVLNVCHQSLIGDATIRHRYEILFFQHQNCSCGAYTPGGDYGVGNWPVRLTLNTWERWRVSWYNAVDLQNNDATAIELERLEAGVWVDYGILYDTNEPFKDSDRNRVGIRLLYVGNWIDDVEIWVPV